MRTLRKEQMHVYQKFSVEHIIKNKSCGLFLDLGLGKTCTTLTAIKQLMFEDLDVEKVLVIAPKKVAQSTWADEIQKWDHTRQLTISVVIGTERQRIEALRAKADIYTINRENVAWLVSYFGGAWPFDMVVIDELSSFKNAKSIRFKALRTVRPLCRRVVGLTGTPAPNGLLDIWPQLYLLDQGERLGKTITGYRDKYFTPGKRNGHVIFNYNLKTDEKGQPSPYEKEIYDKIGDICISMKAKDYLELPDRIDRINHVVLSDTVMQQYLEFEKKLILSLENVEDISTANAAGLTNKLLQFTNGAVYDAEHQWHEVHNEKLEALEEDMEAANGNPVLVFYQFKSDMERILKHFKAYKPQVLNGDKEIKSWNEGKIQMLLAHAASAGHGLNLQFGGHHIEWFGVPWGLELYQQAVARLDRQGQTMPVINSRLIAKGTIDEEVLAALERKASVQDAMMDAVKARIRKYRS